ncbi:MAG: TIGR00159 family protein [Ruminococcaceae bacterium]|nr:TIGR00159 family protein [Oscillospiraceae bacterium]
MGSIANFIEKVSGALMSFDILSDLPDILLVTFIIYEGIKIIRGSRTSQIIKGVILLVVIYGLVKLFNMEASEFLMNKLIENSLIILVVLFSPEIRSILERFGRRSLSNISLFGGKNDASYEKTLSNAVNSFCKAAGDMSESKTGALVVFEKEASLQDVINTGTVLDAKASSELFNGLFFKNSALHDGAVVIRDARIYSAGCILPLTQNASLDSELGTRHRAAIGMSEHSDAIVVVVSEETGAISYSKDGVLTRGVTVAKLREFLLGELVPNKAEGRLGKVKKLKKKSKKEDEGKNETEN